MAARAATAGGERLGGGDEMGRPVGGGEGGFARVVAASRSTTTWSCQGAFALVRLARCPAANGLCMSEEPRKTVLSDCGREAHPESPFCPLNGPLFSVCSSKCMRDATGLDCPSTSYRPRGTCQRSAERRNHPASQSLPRRR